MRRFLLYLGSILFLSLIGLSLYVFFVRSGGIGEEVTPPVQEPIVVESAVFDPNAPLARLSSGVVVGVQGIDEGVMAVFGNGSIMVFDNLGAVLEEYAFGLSPVTAARIAPDGERVAFLVLDTNTLGGRWYVWERGEAIPQTLSSAVDDVQFAPDGTLLRVETSSDDARTRLITEVDGRERTLLNSPIPDLRAYWDGNDSLLLTTQPSAEAPGIAYRYNTRTGGTTRLIGGVYGLSALLLDDILLFSKTVAQGGSRIETYVHEDDVERRLSAVTLPERCIVQSSFTLLCATLSSQAAAEHMPDDYYKGVVTNETSTLVRIDMESGSTVVLSSLPFDAGSLSISLDGQYVFAIDKNSGALWRVRLRSL